MLTDGENDDIRCLRNLERIKIDHNMPCLVNLLDLHKSDFLCHLKEHGCITDKQLKKINRSIVRQRQVQELLEIIKKKSFAVYKKFIHCLNENHQEKMAEILESCKYEIILFLHSAVSGSQILQFQTVSLRKNNYINEYTFYSIAHFEGIKQFTRFKN